MKKFLLFILKFSGFALAVYFILLIVCGSVLPLYLRKNLNYRIGAYGHMHSRMKDIKQVKDVDLVILGSSHAYRGFDTRIFESRGIRAFNLGSSSQTPIQTLMLLEKYLDQLHPKLVLIEVYPEIFGFDGVESSLEIVANEKIDYHVLKMVFKINHIKTYNSTIYSLFRQTFGLDNGFLQHDKDKRDLYISGTGFVSRDMDYFKNISHEPTSWNFNSKQLKAFDQVLEMLKNRNIECVLVQAPFTNSLYNSKINNHYADSFFTSKSRYINFNTRLSLNDSLHFYDADHLNQDGVILFNEAVLDWLKNEKLI
ncbi:MAG: hypothetical protein ABIT06_10035, partial [Saprospiraceae bacterium]